MNTVIIENKDNYSILSINRPDQYNALNEKVLDDLDAHLESIKKNLNCRAVILTGVGQAFIAGADIKAMSKMDKAQAQAFSKKGQDLTMKIEEFHIPIIAAVNGFALGGGCEFAISCHIRYSSVSATFGQPEVSLGLIAGFGGTQRLPSLIGKGRAMEILLGGEKITAEEAFSMGMVNKVFNPENLLPAAEKLAKIISRNAPLSIQATLKLVNKSFDLDINSGLVKECSAFKNLFNSHDTEEGISAFINKRKPSFKGK